MLNGLDLFSGIGGISFALRDFTKTLCYCENDPYCQKILINRMGDKQLQCAPIWDDIRTLSIYDLPKCIDIIYAGFPCQGFSIAGHGKGLEDERSGLFYEIMRLAKEIQPKFIFFENVPNITSSHKGSLDILFSLSKMGYDCRWCSISAASVGALQVRERWFLLAHANSEPSRKTDTETESYEVKQNSRIRLARQDRGNSSRTYWEKNKCPFFGMDYGLPFELDRSKCLGNSVVPQQVKESFMYLMGLDKYK